MLILGLVGFIQYFYTKIKKNLQNLLDIDSIKES